MKQNKYDDPAFYEKYSQMERSQKGLAGAGEWETLQPLLPDLQGKTVLDLGCGFGWHCRYCIAHGAKSVTGVDLSQNMLEHAKQAFANPNITYLALAMEDISFPPESFDLVFSSLALHYVKDYAALCQNIAAILKPGGVFLFSVEHPVFTAEGTQQWKEANGRTYWEVDNYFIEGKRDTEFLGEPVIKYHRTLTAYLDTLLTAGFVLERVVEPQPSEEMQKRYPAMAEELRRPMMLILSARKPE